MLAATAAPPAPGKREGLIVSAASVGRRHSSTEPQASALWPHLIAPTSGYDRVPNVHTRLMPPAAQLSARTTRRAGVTPPPRHFRAGEQFARGSLFAPGQAKGCAQTKAARRLSVRAPRKRLPSNRRARAACYRVAEWALRRAG